MEMLLNTENQCTLIKVTVQTQLPISVYSIIIGLWAEQRKWSVYIKLYTVMDCSLVSTLLYAVN